MKTSRLHFMGIGGQGISAVAQMAHITGETVTGCDQRASATTDAIQQAGIPVFIGHSAEHLKDIDMLVLSPAITALNAHNPELVAAREQGTRIVTWQELFGELMQGKCLLSVSGVHGKGTTTAMLSLMLVDAGLDPTCEIGAIVPRLGANYRLGKSQYVVNEADEFNHNFWHYHPRLVIVTSIEFEHPEFFADYNAFLDAFVYFIRGMDMSSAWPLPPTLILNTDSPGCLELHQRLADWPGRIVYYSIEAENVARRGGGGGVMGEGTLGSPLSHEETRRRGLIDRARSWDSSMSPENLHPTTDAMNEAPMDIPIPRERRGSDHYHAYDIKLDGETSFRIHKNDNSILADDRAIQLQLPGVHNIQNSIAAFAAAHIVGIDAKTIVQTLEGFSGIRRRFEIRHQGPLAIDGTMLDVTIIDDYAHHPTAIAATLAATRRRYPGRRIVAVYQPHMYSRTKTFFEQFLHAFDEADVAIIADIFPAREHDTGLVHARDLVLALAQRPHFAQGHAQVLHGASVQTTADLLRTTLCSGDLVLIMGAGDIYTVTEQLLHERARA